MKPKEGKASGTKVVSVPIPRTIQETSQEVLHEQCFVSEIALNVFISRFGPVACLADTACLFRLLESSETLNLLQAGLTEVEILRCRVESPVPRAQAEPKGFEGVTKRFRR